jgi:hypothetical protein
VTNVLGLIGLVIFIVCIIGLAAAMTWVVVKFSEKDFLTKFLRALGTTRPQ